MSSPTRKKPENMTKNERIAEIKYHRENEAKYHENIEELRKEMKEMKENLDKLMKEKEEFNPRHNYQNRAVQIEKRLVEQEQYSRREYNELCGLPEDADEEDLVNLVVDAFEVDEVPVTRRDFHAIHELRNKKVVIAKLVNRQDATKILRNKKKLREMNNQDQKKLKSRKIYVNETLCRTYRKLLGKCNALQKKKHMTSFYTINGKIKKKYDDQTEEISHENDLIEIFGEAIIKEINEEHSRSGRS